jgi:hypothetical protein
VSSFFIQTHLRFSRSDKPSLWYDKSAVITLNWRLHSWCRGILTMWETHSDMSSFWYDKSAASLYLKGKTLPYWAFTCRTTNGRSGAVASFMEKDHTTTRTASSYATGKRPQLRSRHYLRDHHDGGLGKPLAVLTNHSRPVLILGTNQDFAQSKFLTIDDCLKHHIYINIDIL